MEFRTMKSKKRIIIAAVVALFIIVIFLIVSDDKGEYVPYTEFVSEVENGEISEITISGETVNFYIENKDTLYYTDNPDYDMFKADLMSKGIKVTDEDTAEEAVAYVTDIIFNLLFIGIVAFGLYKVLSSGKKNFQIIKHTNVTFADIAGMDKEKKDMLGILDMMKNPDKYKQKGIRPIKGIILEGPPGNGKTLFAKALAQEAGFLKDCYQRQIYNLNYNGIYQRKLHLFHPFHHHGQRGQVKHRNHLSGHLRFEAS